MPPIAYSAFHSVRTSARSNRTSFADCSAIRFTASCTAHDCVGFRPGTVTHRKTNHSTDTRQLRVLRDACWLGCHDHAGKLGGQSRGVCLPLVKATSTALPATRRTAPVEAAISATQPDSTRQHSQACLRHCVVYDVVKAITTTAEKCTFSLA